MTEFFPVPKYLDHYSVSEYWYIDENGDGPAFFYNDGIDLAREVQSYSGFHLVYLDYTSGDGPEIIERLDYDGLVYDRITFDHGKTEQIYDYRDGTTLSVTSVFYSDSPIVTRHTDGSYDVEQFGNGVHRILHADANRHVFAEERFANDSLGTLLYTVESVGADKVTTNYSQGLVTSQITNKADGDVSTEYYVGYGYKTTQLDVHADGTRDLFKFSNGGVTQHTSYLSNKQLAFTGTVQADGSELVKAAAPGVALEGTAKNDTFISAGDTTFVFKAAFGQDTIKQFHAGDGQGHDQIVINSSLADSFSDLHFEKLGPDTLVHVTEADSILLKGVSQAALTHTDFLFV